MSLFNLHISQNLSTSALKDPTQTRPCMAGLLKQSVSQGGFQVHISLKPAETDLPTWRLPCGSFLVMTRFLVRDYNVHQEKELRKSLQVEAFPARRSSRKNSPVNRTWSAWRPLSIRYLGNSWVPIKGLL